MAGSHASCERDVTDGHIWGTYPDHIPNVNRMFLLGKCWAKCLNACNVLSMFPPKSRYPHPQCLVVKHLKEQNALINYLEEDINVDSDCEDNLMGAREGTSQTKEEAEEETWEIQKVPRIY
jgi:hypothetical protein